MNIWNFIKRFPLTTYAILFILIYNLWIVNAGVVPGSNPGLGLKVMAIIFIPLIFVMVKIMGILNLEPGVAPEIIILLLSLVIDNLIPYLWKKLMNKIKG